MKKIKLLALTFLLGIASCSKSEDNPAPVVVDPNAPSVAAANVVIEPSAVSGVNYKAYLQKPATATNRKGLIILAHGDGGNENDGILNDQCIALANEGYVAVTTTYRPLVLLTYEGNYNSFKTDMQNAVTWLNAEYNIPVNKTMLGGFSRGGNLAFNMFLPADVGAAIQPTNLNLKGAILMCAGGNNWQGGAILKPVIFMANKVDAAVQIIDADTFKAGLATNNNPDVKTLSECLIFNSNGHCTNAASYKPFLVRKVKELLS